MIKPNNLNICVVGSPDVDRLAVFDTNNGSTDRRLWHLSIPRVDAPEGHGEVILGNHFDAIGGAKAGKLASIHTVGSMEFGGGMILSCKSGNGSTRAQPSSRN